MKISISVPGRFHGFDLARELQKHNSLHVLVTSYPRFKARQFGIRGEIKTIFSKELIIRVYYKLFHHYPNWFWLNEWFDKIASYMLPMDSDAYILWAGFALHSIRRIKKENPNAKIILERGSAHIEEQQRLLCLVEQEDTINCRVLQKELQEYQECDYISVPGKFVERTFLKKSFANEKIFINPYGVDLNVFLNPQTDKSSDVFTVGFVGVVSKQKNVEGIIQSVKKLTDKGYCIKLLIAGGIDTDSYSLKYLDQFDFVSYLGIVPQHQLSAVYTRMDAFILNSVQEGFGMVLLQAMAMGITPIATQNSGGVELIEDGINGYLIPILDNEVLANRIEALINNPQKRKHMGQLSRAKVMEGFSWQDYGDRYFKFLKELQ